MEIKSILYVALGGSVGSIMRFAISIMTSKPANGFPLGTFLANIIGCLIIGLFYGYSKRLDWLNTDMKLLIATGFCGGFTTFSSFAYENILLFQEGNYTTFIVYTLSSVILCFSFTYLGLYLSK